MYDVYEIRKDFPILSELINGKPNTFLDTAASAQKPRQVIEKMNEVYFGQYANVHRGSYYLSEQATAEYENARRIAADFINAAVGSCVDFKHIHGCAVIYAHAVLAFIAGVRRRPVFAVNSLGQNFCRTGLPVPRGPANR